MKKSTNKKELFMHLFNGSLVTVIGQTGSGKSQIIFSYFDHLTQRYAPEELKIRAYDVVNVDYWEEEPVMPWADVVRYPEAGTPEPILADIKLVEDRIAGATDCSQKTIIHINECDLFQTDFRESVIELCTLIAKHGMDINMQLIYETSRPAEPALPKVVVDASDVKIACPLPREEYTTNFIGKVESFPQKQGEMLIYSAILDTVLSYSLYLPRGQAEEEQTVCPKCGGVNLREYIYGKPSPELIAEAKENDDIILAGCVIEPDSPGFYCRDCDISFGEPDWW